MPQAGTSTVKRRAKAARVFGDMFADEVNGSLCYSPSPATKETRPCQPSVMAGVTLSPIRASFDGSVDTHKLSPTVLFSRRSETSFAPKLIGRRLPSQSDSNCIGDDKENKENLPVIGATVGDCAVAKPSRADEMTEGTAPDTTEEEVAGNPLATTVLPATSRDDPSSVFPSLAGTPQIKGDVDVDVDDDSGGDSNTNSGETNKKNGKPQLAPRTIVSEETKQRWKQLRVRSPIRPDLVKRTQQAIKAASTSVNQTINASKQAKKTVVHAKKQETKKVRFQWKEDILEARHFNQETEQKRRAVLSLKRQISSKHFKEKARRDHTTRSKQISELEREYTFNADVHREQQRKLREEAERRRRESVAKRANIRANNRAGELKMKVRQIEEEKAIFEIRHDLSLARREGARQYADARRKSYQFRAGDAKRIRELRKEWKAETAKQQAASYELKRQAERDADNYKKALKEQRRLSQENRGVRARTVRKEEADRRGAEVQAEHESYELKWAGEKDAEAYQARVREERRQSIENRNKESSRHAKVMKELRSLAKEKETESYLLKWAAENDVKAYLAKSAEERRQSLEQRGKEFVRRKKYDEAVHSASVEAAVMEGQLQSQCHHDVEQYKKDCTEHRRKSLQYRGKKFALQQLEERVQRAEAQDADRKNFEIDSEAWRDVQNYIDDCKKRKRKSLALRAKEKRKHFAWAQSQKAKETEQLSREVNYRLWDARYVAQAKQKERALAAADALRSAGIFVKGNPFSSLLEE